MCQVKENSQSVVYYDVTAGRGSYDDGFENELNDIIQFNKQSHDCNEETKESNKEKSSEHHTTFKNFTEIQPKQLPRHNFNDLQEQRRHSYSRGPARGRASGRTYPQQTQNFASIENSRNHSNENKSVFNANNANVEINKRQVKPAQFNWCPKRISKA